MIHKASCGCSIKKIIITIILFFCIFQPIFCKISSSYIAMMMMILYFCGYCIKHSRLVIPTDVLSICCGFLPFLLYVIIETIFRCVFGHLKSNLYIDNLFRIINPILFISITILFVISLTNNGNKLRTKMVLNMLMYVMALQLSFVLLGILNPSFQQTIIEKAVSYIKNDILINAIERHRHMRIYGMTGTFFDIYSIISSVLIILTFLKGVYEKKMLYVGLSIVMLAVPILNARSGLVISILGMLIVCFILRKNIKIHYLVFLSIICLSLFFIMFSYMPTYIQLWVKRGLDSVLALLSGTGRTGTFNNLLLSDLVLPSGIDFLFGLGVKPEVIGIFGTDGTYIDMGYVQSIWRFGIFGTCLLVFGYINMFYLFFVKSKRSLYNRCIGFTLILVLLLSYFKRFIWAEHSFNFVIFSIIIMLIIQRDKQSNVTLSNSICNNCNL